MKQLFLQLNYAPDTQYATSGLTTLERGLFTETFYTLTISLGTIYGYLSRLWIFSESNAVIFNPIHQKDADFYRAQPSNRKTFTLPAGIYIVRLVIDGQFTDKKIVLDKNKICAVGINQNHGFNNEAIDDYLDVPELYSSVPLRSEVPYASTFDYYEDAALEASSHPTILTDHSDADSGLFIFLRFPSAAVFQDKYSGKAYWEKFALYNRNWELITKFTDGVVIDAKDHQGIGCLGFSARLLPNLYFLEYDGPDKRTIPIYVFERWHTQLFMTLGEEPLFGSLKIFINRDMTFNSRDPNYLFVDICLSKLQNRDFTIDPELLQTIVQEKFESPMLGLLGAYIYLSSKESKNDQLFQAIVRNLQRIILMNSANSQDIYALNFLSFEHWGNVLDSEVIPNTKDTPMLRIAYDTIRHAASKHGWVVPAGSLNDHIAECQYFDSPFNTFKTFHHDQQNADRKGLIKPNISPILPRKYFNLHVSTLRSLLNITLNDTNDAGGFTLDYSFNKHMPNIPHEGLGYTDHHEDHYKPPENIHNTGGSTNQTFARHLKKLLNKPHKMGRFGAAITHIILENTKALKNISDDEIALQLNLPIETVTRLRIEWNLFPK